MNGNCQDLVNQIKTRIPNVIDDRELSEDDKTMLAEAYLFVRALPLYLLLPVVLVGGNQLVLKSSFSAILLALFGIAAREVSQSQENNNTAENSQQNNFGENYTEERNDNGVDKNSYRGSSGNAGSETFFSDQSANGDNKSTSSHSVGP